ncbi:MAG: hypothetical protein M3Q73_03270, partial [bacterium]|nr:hypothetical protein [bacterium]
NKNDSNYVWARQHLDRSVASCAWWWSTGRKLLEIVPESPICWNPSEIEKGAQEMLTAVRSLHDINGEIKVEAEEYFTRLRTYVWKTHWLQYYKK